VPDLSVSHSRASLATLIRIFADHAAVAPSWQPCSWLPG